MAHLNNFVVLSLRQLQLLQHRRDFHAGREYVGTVWRLEFQTSSEKTWLFSVFIYICYPVV